MSSRIEDPEGRHRFESGFKLTELENLTAVANQHNLATDVFGILKQKPDLKIKIESTLSSFFEKKLIFKEEAGFLKPKIFSDITDSEYDFKEDESHGLKEIIALLTILYDDDSNVLIIDEPESHIHPQFQEFFLAEIKKVAGDPEKLQKKCIFLITHSPFFVSINSLEDLKNCLVFHHKDNPTSIDTLSEQDEYRLNRLFPRWNIHHKQFFFATNPIFVEGYTDQQMFSLIQARRDRVLGANGATLIDVNGKENFDVFFRLCDKLKINGKFICDLDIIFEGGLRGTVSSDPKCQKFSQDQGWTGGLTKTIGELETSMDKCVSAFMDKMNQNNSSNTELDLLHQELDKVETNLVKKRIIFLTSLQTIENEIKSIIPDLEGDLNTINGKFEKILDSFKTCNVFILRKGALENYLPTYEGNPYKVQNGNKFEIWEKENEFVLTNNVEKKDMEKRYPDLTLILDEVIPISVIDVDPQLNHFIRNWIHDVQMILKENDTISNLESFKNSKRIINNSYSRIFEIIEFSRN